jgi:hypothetical protein
MCVVSYVGDYWKKKLPEKHPWAVPYPVDPVPYWPNNLNPTREEFKALKKEIEELKKLLISAKKFDENTGQPDCEMDEKVELIKKFAEYVGVDMKDVFK